MDIQQQHSSQHSKQRTVTQKRSSTFIDMTPMVDLAFLLLTFLILTTSFRNMRIIDLVVPDNKPTKNPNTIAESQLLMKLCLLILAGYALMDLTMREREFLLKKE